MQRNGLNGALLLESENLTWLIVGLDRFRRQFNNGPLDTLERMCAVSVLECFRRSLVQWSIGVVFACSVPSGLAAAPSPVQSVVNTSIARAGSFRDAYTAVGTLAAHQGVLVAPETSGRIVAMSAKSGQWVHKGSALFTLNADVTKGALRQAEAKMQWARHTYHRTEALFHNHTLSKSAYDQAKAAYLEAMGAYSQIQAQLDQKTIRAPFSGLLGLTQAHVGDFVTAGQPLVALQAMDPMWVDFSLPQDLMGKVKVGQAVNIEINAYPQTAFKGRVIAVDSTLSVKSRELLVRAAVHNPKHALLPGAYVRAQLLYGQSRPAVFVPEMAVMYEATGKFVYVVRKGVAQKTPVVMEASTAGEAVIQSGLHAGDVVVSAGQQKINDGSSVRCIPLKSTH